MTTIVIACVGCACYLLFAGTVSFHELATAIVLAFVGGLWSFVIRRNSEERFTITGETVVRLLRAIRDLVPATLSVGAVMLRVIATGASPGRTVETQFRHGADRDPRERSRRALAVLIASLAPDRFVVDAAPGKRALVHFIVSSHHPLDERWLE